MIYNDKNNSVNYPISSEEDELWGLTITTVGRQNICEKENYPPEKADLPQETARREMRGGISLRGRGTGGPRGF